MSYHTDSSMDLHVVPGTSRLNVLGCLRNVIAHLKEVDASLVSLDDLQVAARYAREFAVWFDETTGDVGVFVDRDVSDGFESLMDEAAKQLSKFAVTGFYWEWSNQDSGDPEDNVKTPRFFGPTPEAKQACAEAFMIEEVMSHISRVDYTDGKDSKNTRTALARRALTAIFAPKTPAKSVVFRWGEHHFMITPAFDADLLKLSFARELTGASEIIAPLSTLLETSLEGNVGDLCLCMQQHSFQLRDGQFDLFDVPTDSFRDGFAKANAGDEMSAFGWNVELRRREEIDRASAGPDEAVSDTPGVS